EPGKKAVAPGGERGDLLLEGCLVVRQQRLEIELVLGELLPGDELHFVELGVDALGGDLVERQVVHVVLEPLAACRAPADAHRPAHAAVQLGQRDYNTGPLERLAQSTVFRASRHRSTPTCRSMLTLRAFIIDPRYDA